jgi:hypothetical protein
MPSCDGDAIGYLCVLVGRTKVLNSWLETRKAVWRLSKTMRDGGYRPSFLIFRVEVAIHGGIHPDCYPADIMLLKQRRFLQDF